MNSRIVKISVAVILVLALVVYNFYDYWLERRLHYQLSEIINKNPESLYRYSFSKLDIHIMGGSIDLEGITIKPTQQAIDSLNSENNGLRFLLDLSMEEIELDGFDVKSFLATGKISVDSLIISEPVFEYYFHPRKKSASQVMPLQNVFNEKFIEANLQKFIIRNGTIKIDDETEEGAAINIHRFNIELTGARMDRSTLKRFSPFDYEDIKMIAAGIHVDASEDFTIESDTIFFDVEKEALDIKNFQLKPKHTQEKFSSLYDYQKQWFAIKLDHLILDEINMQEFVETGLIDIGIVDLKNPSLALYKDKTKPVKNKVVKSLPVSQIQSINWVLNVDSIRVHNGFVTIDQTSEHTGQNSHLFFSDLNGTIVHFTNDSVRTMETSIMYIDASGSVLGSALAELHLRFDLMSLEDEFHAWGKLGETDATKFSTVLDPMIGLKIKGGDVHGVSFNFQANSTKSYGTLEAEYEGIKIELLKEDTAGTSKKGLMSFAANSVINSYNRADDPSYRHGIINATRNTEKGIFSYLWDSLQSGLVSIMAPFTNDKETKQQQKVLRKKRKKKNKESNG